MTEVKRKTRAGWAGQGSTEQNRAPAPATNFWCGVGAESGGRVSSLGERPSIRAPPSPPPPLRGVFADASDGRISTRQFAVASQHLARTTCHYYRGAGPVDAPEFLARRAVERVKLAGVNVTPRARTRDWASRTRWLGRITEFSPASLHCFGIQH
ncbi:hypothetical protein ANO11243_059810 [Dothideomycetidae sp. 11243]|nr:hypothetical protein ANO11243_059810 [fungal sp. No.11243]